MYSQEEKTIKHDGKYYRRIKNGNEYWLDEKGQRYLDDFGNMSIEDIQHYSFTNYPVCVYNLLLENHFDVFGLIHNNMAVSIHDVEQVIA